MRNISHSVFQGKVYARRTNFFFFSLYFLEFLFFLGGRMLTISPSFGWPIGRSCAGRVVLSIVVHPFYMVVQKPLTHLTISCISHCSLMRVFLTLPLLDFPLLFLVLLFYPPQHVFRLVGVFESLCALYHDRSYTRLVQGETTIEYLAFIINYLQLALSTR